MSRRQKILLSLFIAIVIIQFIQPARNKSSGTASSDITEVLNVPPQVATILKRSCYDCHSNNTNYPWYSRIQPFGWMLAKHIRDGKADLNFNEFGVLSRRRQMTKLRGIANSVEDETMPLRSYVLLHPGAAISANEKSLLVDWATAMRDSLSVIK